MKHAFPRDELRSVSCSGMDTFGSYSLTLIDSLDSLLIFNRTADFQRAVAWLGTKLAFDVDKTVSLFETNIRVLGGLVSGYAFWLEHYASSFDASPLLRLAVDLANRLLPAFATPTGIPYGSINLRRGVVPGESLITSTAGGGSYMVEFGMLSALTGNPAYWLVARRSYMALWRFRTKQGLLGSHIHIQTGAWTEALGAVGSNVDSFYEYGLKAALLFDDEEVMGTFVASYRAAQQYLHRDGWFLDIGLSDHRLAAPVAIQHLQGFWFGMQVLFGDVAAAARSMRRYHAVFRRAGAMPERFDLFAAQPIGDSEGSAYHLRPELAESLYYLSQAWPNAHEWQTMALDHVHSLAGRMQTACGFGGLSDVRKAGLIDRMESFLLAETLKYLLLTFDPDHMLHRRANVIFSTEGHAMPISQTLRKRLSVAAALVGTAGGLGSSSAASGAQPLMCPRVQSDDAGWLFGGREQHDFFTGMSAADKAAIMYLDDVALAVAAAAAAASAAAQQASGPATSTSPSPPARAPSVTGKAPVGAPGSAPASAASLAGDAAMMLLVIHADGLRSELALAQAMLSFRPQGTDQLALQSVNGVSVAQARGLYLLHSSGWFDDDVQTSVVVVPSLLSGHGPFCVLAGAALYGPSVDQAGLSQARYVALAEPRDACSAISAVPRDSAVLAVRGECMFIDKTMAAQGAGAGLLLVANHAFHPGASDETGPVLAMAGDGNATREESVRIGSVMVPFETAELLIRLAGGGDNSGGNGGGGEVCPVERSLVHVAEHRDAAAEASLAASTVKMMYEGKIVANVRVLHPSMAKRGRLP